MAGSSGENGEQPPSIAGYPDMSGNRVSSDLSAAVQIPDCAEHGDRGNLGPRDPVLISRITAAVADWGNYKLMSLFDRCLYVCVKGGSMAREHGRRHATDCVWKPGGTA